MNIFNIKKQDIVSITGGGGKTSLMFFLARKLSKKGRVLVTTTTKIYKPSKDLFEHLLIEDDTYRGSASGIDVIGSSLRDGKLIGLTYEEIEDKRQLYDYILVEADGAKEMSVKGWNKTEPCIPNSSNLVIGVANIKSIGIDIDDRNIHRLELFKELIGRVEKDYIDIDVFNRYLDRGDFFKGSCGRNISFINGVEKIEDIKRVMELSIKKENFYIGSIHEEWIERYKDVDAIVMASGFAKRFGSNKLLEMVDGKKVIESSLDLLKNIPFNRVIVVGRGEEVKGLVEERGFEYIENVDAHLGQSESVKLGANNSKAYGMMFIPADQILLTEEILLKLIMEFQKKGGIVRPIIGGRYSSPVIFLKEYREGLLGLSGDEGGRSIIKNSNCVTLVEFEDKNKFMDIDNFEDLEKVRSEINKRR